MDAAEIVKAEVKRDSGFKVLNFLGERICESRKSAAHHAKR